MDLWSWWPAIEAKRKVVALWKCDLGGICHGLEMNVGPMCVAISQRDLQVPYSGKLSREKTFTKVSPRKLYFSLICEGFLSQKFSTIWYTQLVKVQRMGINWNAIFLPITGGSRRTLTRTQWSHRMKKVLQSQKRKRCLVPRPPPRRWLTKLATKSLKSLEVLALSHTTHWTVVYSEIQPPLTKEAVVTRTTLIGGPVDTSRHYSLALIELTRPSSCHPSHFCRS